MASGSRDRLLIDAVRLVAHGADALDGLIDRVVVLEHPGKLHALELRRRAHQLVQLADEERKDADGAVLGQDAKEQQSQLRDDLPAAEQSNEAERKQPS